jgi:undecaprenyl-diphosphatase
MPTIPRDPAPLLLGCFIAACALGAMALHGSAADRDLLLAINQAATRLPLPLPSMLTVLGNGLAAAMLLSFFLRRDPGRLLAALLAMPVGAVFSSGGKFLWASPRPAAVLEPGLLHIQGPVLAGHNAFPSGHALTAFLCASVVALSGVPGRRQPALALAALALAAAVALSRPMVGAHWPGDALGGAALGCLAGLAGDALGRRIAPGALSARSVRLLAAVVLAGSAALALGDTGYPLARPLQYLLALAGGLYAAGVLRRPLPA